MQVYVLYPRDTTNLLWGNPLGLPSATDFQTQRCDWAGPMLKCRSNTRQSGTVTQWRASFNLLGPYPFLFCMWYVANSLFWYDVARQLSSASPVVKSRDIATVANLVHQDQLFSLNLKISFCCFAHQSGIQGGNSIARASLIHLKTRHLESQQQANLLSVKTRLWTGYGPEPFYFFQNSRVRRGHLRPQFPVHYSRIWKQEDKTLRLIRRSSFNKDYSSLNVL